MSKENNTLDKPQNGNDFIADVMAMLPTDEEIKNMMTTSHYNYETGHYRKVRLDRIQGAKMVRDLIKKRLTGN